MEIINKNYIDTTTSIVVNSNTETALNIMTRDDSWQWSSLGFNSDAATARITVSFPGTLTVSRIALVGINFKGFRIFANGSTASTFQLTSTAATTTVHWLNNLETAMYLVTKPISCTSVTLEMNATHVTDQEKAVGYYVLSDLLSDLSGRVPPAQGYAPLIRPKEVLHELSDGSFRAQIMDRKFSANVKLDFISESAKTELENIFKLHDDFIFTAFPTASSWDEVIYPCIWTGAFEFYQVTDNALESGYSGSIRLVETRP